MVVAEEWDGFDTSLEQILLNVRRNNVWETEERIAETKKDIQIRYRAYREIVERKGTPREIAKAHGLPRETVYSWKAGVRPSFFETYARSVLPESKEERKAFAYLLGVYARNKRESFRKERKLLHRESRSKEAKERIGDAVNLLLGRQPKKVGNTVRVHHERFVRTLEHCLCEEFNSYVRTEEERISFLRGVFDVSKIHPRLISNTGRYDYFINCGNEVAFKAIVTCLFELDILPKIEPESLTIQIASNYDLQRFHTLHIDQEKESRRKISQFLRKRKRKEYSVSTYYGIRRKVERLLKEGKKIVWRRMAHEAGVTQPVTLHRWVADIVERVQGKSSYEHRTLRRSTNYEKIIAFLGMPHVYESKEPVQRNRKIFLPVGDEVYILPAEVQYSCWGRGLEREEMEYVRRDLKRYKKGEKGRYSFRITGDLISRVREINPNYREYVFRDELAVDVDGKEWVITNNALLQYFTSFGLEPEPLDSDHIEKLKEGLLSELDGDTSRDMIYKFRGNRVSKILVNKGVQGGNKIRHDKTPIGYNSISLYDPDEWL